MQSYRYTFRAMASEHELVLHARDESTARKAADAAIADVARIEAKYSRFRGDGGARALRRPVLSDERRRIRSHLGRAAARVEFPAATAARSLARRNRCHSPLDRLGRRRVDRQYHSTPAGRYGDRF